MKRIGIHLRAREPAQRWAWGAGLAAAMAAGCVFRLIWLRDVEFKLDEATALHAVQDFWATRMWPAVGIGSSFGLPNPGLNVWLLIAISAFLPVIGPLEMTRAVQVGNVVAILLLAWFARRATDRDDRETWLWSAALVAVNPVAVMYSRKLWVQELSPLLTLTMLWGWRWRAAWWGAFLWGFVGALLGQVHLTGFLFAFAFFLVALLLAPRSVHWPGWLAGSAIGALGLIPWLLDAVGRPHAIERLQLQNPIVPFGHWVNYALGTDLYKSLDQDIALFLRYPEVAGVSTWLGAAALAAIIGVFVVLLLRLVRRGDSDGRSLWAEMRSSEPGLVLIAGCLCYCALLAMMPRPAYLHYLIEAFCLPALSLAWLGLTGGGLEKASGVRRWLAAMVAAQATVTLLLLCFIHERQVINGDYGATYGAQYPER